MPTSNTVVGGGPDPDRDPLRVKIQAALRAVVTVHLAKATSPDRRRGWGRVRDELAVGDWMLEQARHSPQHRNELRAAAVGCLEYAEAKAEELTREPAGEATGASSSGGTDAVNVAGLYAMYLG